MQSADPPTTPLKRVDQNALPPIESTPNNNGTAVNSEQLGRPTVDAVSPALLEDIRKHEKRPVKDVLEAFLMLCLPESQKVKKPKGLLQTCLKAVLPICNGKSSNGKKVRVHLQEYIDIKSDETARYKPFVFAFNRALEDLSTVKCKPLRPPSDLKIMFHRNDPMYIKGKHDGGDSLRKPDTILAALETVRAAHNMKGRGEWSDFAYDHAGAAPRNRFGWEGTLGNQEFKMTKAKIAALLTVYRAGALLRKIDPQSLPDSLVEINEVETVPLEASRNSQLPLAEGSVQDSGEPKVRSRRSARLAAKSGEGSSIAQAVDASSGKRKRDDDPQGSNKRRIQESVPTRLPTRIPAMVQSASYAADRISHAFWVTHVINLVIVNDVAYVWYYDNENSVQSFGINFIQDLPYFLVLLLAFQRFSLQNWGVMKEFQVKTKESPPRALSPDEKISLHLDASPNHPELEFTLYPDKLRGHYGLRGRCTQVLKTTSSSPDPRDITKNLKDVDMVSKLYWPQESRVPEATILEKAREVGKGNKYIEGHLPDLIFTYDFDQYSTIHIRRLLGINTGSEKRLLRLIVFRRLYPITNLVGTAFWKIFWECFCCHLHLWIGGVLHCDISVSNLMYDEDNDRGILNDFDLALLRDEPSPSGTDRTGTMLFMALDLLKAPAWNGRVRREYRHDAESFAWALLWICCTYVDGKELPRRPLRDLIQHTFEATYDKKFARIRNPREGLQATASYSRKYLGITHNLLLEYRDRHNKVGVDRWVDDDDSEMNEYRAERDHPEDELKAIKEETGMWLKELASTDPDLDFGL